MIQMSQTLFEVRELVKPYLSACTFRRRRLPASSNLGRRPPDPRRTPSRSVCSSIALQHHPRRWMPVLDRGAEPMPGGVMICQYAVSAAMGVLFYLSRRTSCR